MPNINNLKVERSLLTHGFRGVSPWLSGSIPLGLRLSIMVEGYSRGKLLSCDSQEAEKEKVLGTR